MKKLKFFTLALFFGMTSMFASENTDETNIEIRDQISALFDNAYTETVDDLNMTLTFTFNSEGEIVVLNVDSNRKDIKDFVRKYVNNQKLESPGLMNVKYMVPINVRSL